MSNIKIRGPKGCGATLSFAGKEYKADKKGLFTVPYEALEHLRLHGFSVDGDPEPEETDEERAAREAAEAEAAAAAAKAAADAGAQP